MPWVLFDFDGVIANSEAAILLAMHDIARVKGWPMVSSHALQTESTRALMRRWGIRFWHLPGLVRMARKSLAQHRHLIKPYPHVLPALAWARDNAVRLGIVTSNSPTLVRAFLDEHLPQSGFDVIKGDVSLFGKHRAIKRLLREHKVAPGRAVYVGDEVRDVQAAKRAGVRACAVTWGKERDAVLLEASPTYIARNADDLRQVMAAACKLGSA
jgi:phosphoglycolate phosphatase